MSSSKAQTAQVSGGWQSSAPAQDPPNVCADVVLRTVCLLAKAASAQLLQIEPWGDAITAHANTHASIPAQIKTALSRSSSWDARAKFPLAQARWVSEANAVEASLVLRLDDHPSGCHLLALSFNDVDSFARARVERIMPDLGRLIKITVDQEEKARDFEQRYAAMAAALDDGECGMIGVRSDHSIVFSNAAATRMITENDGFHVARGLLRPTQYADVVRFHAALDSVTQPLPQAISKRRRALVMMLAPEGKRRSKIVAITPADRPGSPSTDPLAAKALIYILEPNGRQATGILALCSLHGLSKVEGRLACHLCEGLTLNEAATQMRIKLETARAYLKQAFIKTETHRQAELVTLLTRYVRAMRGDHDFQAA